MKDSLCRLNLLIVLFYVAGRERVTYAEQFSIWRENVLGTSMQWTVETDQRELAEASENWAVAEIEELESKLSRYRQDSELNRLATLQGRTVPISKELADVLRWCEQLRKLTSGAFDIRVLALTGEKPNVEITGEPFKLETGGKNEHLLTVLDWPKEGWTLDSVAKGYILDRIAIGSLQQFPGLKGVCINIGGDIRMVGAITNTLSVENPFHAAEETTPVESWLQSGSKGIATSGGYRRFVQSPTGPKSHLMDARSGRHVQDSASVTVIAPTAMEADGLATAVSVVGVEAGLELIESRQQCSCLIVDNNGMARKSSRWSELTRRETKESTRVTSDSTEKATSMNRQQENELLNIAKPSGLHVYFELARPSGAAYRRPYLALWLEDEDGFPVKTALLWLQTEQPGPRWHRDLSRWYRGDRARKVAEKKDLIGVISGATQGPGKYQAHFDGTDNEGSALPSGNYTLCLEVAREHGTHQLIRHALQWNELPISLKQLDGNIEVSAFAFELNPVTSASDRIASEKK